MDSNGPSGRSLTVLRGNMRPMLMPQLVNPAFGDPGLYVDFRNERRALLFDIGDIGALAPRKLLRLSHVFVSHTHMDHFMGFDALLRVSLGRDVAVRLFGPPGFVDQVAHKLAAYTWNLVESYPGDFSVLASELSPEGRLASARFRCRRRFERETLEGASIDGGILVDEPGFRVRTAFLEHRTPCLAFALEEKAHVNVWKNRLDEMGLPVGPWIRELKEAVLRGAADDTPVRASWKENGERRERVVALGELKARALQIVPGEKLCYVTDAAFSEQNARRIAALAKEADLLFIESVFLHEDADQAQMKRHLTARQAGEIARAAGAKVIVPFHFSPRYAERESELRAELEHAFRGSR
jgi:ribonuclease Z